MKGLSIGRAELVNRFLSQERQRLGRSMASISFQSEMRHQSDRLVGGLSSGSPVSTRAGRETQESWKQLNDGRSQTPKTLLGVEKSERAELEIADPLLLQEILAAFCASAEARKKAADRTGDQGALPVEDLIAMLEKSEEEALFEGEGGEAMPAEVFRKLIDTIRWSDDKHKAFVHAENLAPQVAYDRRSFIDGLKNLLQAAKAQGGVSTPSQPVDAFSPTASTALPRDTIGPAGVFDAVPEDFKNFMTDGPFRLWRRSGTEHVSSDERTVSENAKADEAQYGGADVSPYAENREPRAAADLMGVNAAANGAEGLKGTSTSFPAGISEKVRQTLARPMTFQGAGNRQTELGAFPDQGGSFPVSSPEDALGVSDPDLPPWDRSGRPSVVAIRTAPFNETGPGVQPRTVDAPVGGLDANPAASFSMAAEVHETVSDFLRPVDAAYAEDLFPESHVFVHDMGHGSGSTATGSSPFGESSHQNDDAFFQAAPQGSAQGRALREPNEALWNRTTPSSPSATLPLLSPNWPRELGQKLSHRIASGESFMTLALHPESLGKLFLRVETDGSRVTAIVQTETPEAREILQRNIASLRDALGVQEIVSDFSRPVDAAHTEDPFLESHVFVHGMGHGSGSTATGSSPFGESPRQNDDAFSQAAPQGSAQGAPFSELAGLPSSRATPSSASPTLSLFHSDWPRELGQKLSHWARSGKSSMTLELQPESLGKLFLRVETDGTRVSALVQTEHPEAREILQRNMASLRDVLAENGLQLSRFSVDVRHDNTSFAERHLARWAHDEQRTPTSSLKGGEGENLLNVLHVYDAGLGRALSVRV
ncbi:flagellar hook-length control protein FliK [Desulfosoma sp.]